jgi:hypothetical protein
MGRRPLTWRRGSWPRGGGEVRGDGLPAATRGPVRASARVAHANDEACLEGALVDVSVQFGVLELPGRVGIDEDTRRAVLDHEVASKRFVLDGVVPGSVDRRMRAGRDSESCIRTGILSNDELDDGADRFGRQRKHRRSMRHIYSRSNAMGALDRIKQWFRKEGGEAETVAKGGEPDATPPDGGLGEPERETSTNAQTQGASDEPWPK